MTSIKLIVVGVVAACVLEAGIVSTQAASLAFNGTQFDIGGTYYPGYEFPQVDIVPWRSDGEGNLFSISSEIDHRYYGTAGYALFATRFAFPNVDAHPPAARANIDPTIGDPDYPNIIDLPNFVTNSQILGARMAAGWAYAIIDDPRMQAGPRFWTFDGTNYPPPNGTNGTGVVPFVKLGIIDGVDVFGNNPTVQDPSQPTGIGFLSYRWGFQVGANVPKSFRIGVMTDGLDATVWTPTEVQMHQVSTATPIPTVVQAVTTGTIPTQEVDGRNRFVDMHFFDITDAQPGDQFAFAIRSELGGGHSGGISGFSFDIIDPTTQGVPGDYNSDGQVNAADYTVWRDRLGQTFQLPNEGAGQSPGLVTAEDFDFWKSQFGAGGGGGGGALATGVPEPSSLVLLLLAIAVSVGRLGRR
jgi:hypothetical protein